MWTLILLLGSSFPETSLGWTYHYSKTPMTWAKAREWCQKHYTDMVVIQNQEENDFVVSMLPKRTCSPYYWIGITRNHINGTWTWIGNNSTWVGEESWAANEPNNNDITEFCVEIYVNPRSGNDGKWNDEKCGSKKFPVCYKAQCNATSCGRGRCQETIKNITCICEPGFEGDRCQTVVVCDKDRITVPSKGSVECTNQYGNFSYNSSCQYSCEEGYRLSKSGPLTCTASTEWSDQPPTCELVQCEPLSPPERGSMTCSDRLGPSSFQSTCEFTCEEGYVLSGSPSNTLQCEASGTWNFPQPFCVVVECPSLLQPDDGNYSCSGEKRTFNTTCRFNCHPGFLMIGSPAVTCGVTGVWSGPRPACVGYKQALMAVAGCGALSTFCCICCCWMKRRKRKKLAQEREPEEVTASVEQE